MSFCSCRDCPSGSDGKASAYNAGDLGSVPGSRRPPGEVNGNPLQYSCLENPIDQGAWQAIVHRVQRVRQDWVTSLSLSLCSCTVYPVKIMLAISVRIHNVLILGFNTQVTFDIFFNLFLLPSVLKKVSRFIFSGIVSEL